MNSFADLHPLLERIGAALPEFDRIYLVGGAVRDLLRGEATHDLDFAVPHGGIAAGRRAANALGGDFYPLDPERDTGRALLTRPDGGRLLLDFAAFRGPDLAADLADRDFTINAIAIEIHRPGEIIDPLSGGRDLRNKRLRACSPDSFVHDPVRILRAVRQAIAFSLRIDPETIGWLRQAVPLVQKVSAERIRDEIFKILDGPNPAAALRMLDILGGMTAVFPDLAALHGVEQSPPHVLDAWEHTLDTVRWLDDLLETLKPEHDPESAANWTMGLVSVQLGRYRRQIAEHLARSLNPERSLRALLLLAALFHDAGKPAQRTIEPDGRVLFRNHETSGADIARRYAIAARLSRAEMERLYTIVHGHMLPVRLTKNAEPPSRVEIYRFFRSLGEAGVDVCLLALADTLAVYGTGLPQEVWIKNLEVVRALLEAYWEKNAEIVSPPALVNGNDLIDSLAISAGPRIGEFLEAIREAQVAGEVTNREQALDLVRSFLET